MTQSVECPVCYDSFSKDEVLICSNNHIHCCATCLSQITTDICSICRVDVFNNPIRDLYIDSDSDMDSIGEPPEITPNDWLDYFLQGDIDGLFEDMEFMNAYPIINLNLNLPNLNRL